MAFEQLLAQQHADLLDLLGCEYGRASGKPLLLFGYLAGKLVSLETWGRALPPKNWPILNYSFLL